MRRPCWFGGAAREAGEYVPNSVGGCRIGWCRTPNPTIIQQHHEAARLMSPSLAHPLSFMEHCLDVEGGGVSQVWCGGQSVGVRVHHLWSFTLGSRGCLFGCCATPLRPFTSLCRSVSVTHAGQPFLVVQRSAHQPKQTHTLQAARPAATRLLFCWCPPPRGHCCIVPAAPFSTPERRLLGVPDSLSVVSCRSLCCSVLCHPLPSSLTWRGAFPSAGEGQRIPICISRSKFIT